MTDLDVLAIEHIDRLDIPPGVGLDVVMQRGRRHRNRRRAVAGLGGALVSIVILLGLVVVATRTVGDDDRIVMTDSAETTDVPDATADGAPVREVVIDTHLLPSRDPSLIPTVPTPMLEGWSLDVTAVELNDRFANAGQTVSYRLRASGSELHMAVLPGQVALDGERVTVERPMGPVEASLQPDGDAMRRLAWNERPGVNTGTGVWLVGPADDQLLAVAAAVEFVDLPLTGASDPTFVNLDPDRATLFAGSVDGVDWKVAVDGDGETSIEIDGRSPSLTGGLARTGSTGAEITTTTVSYDGRQITTLVVPADTTAVEFGLADGSRIPLPLDAIDATGERISVAAVPIDREPAVIVVTQSDGTETNVGLPVAPLDGWTTSTQSLGSM